MYNNENKTIEIYTKKSECVKIKRLANNGKRHIGHRACQKNENITACTARHGTTRHDTARHGTALMEINKLSPVTISLAICGSVLVSLGVWLINYWYVKRAQKGARKCPGPRPHWLFGNVSVFRETPEEVHLRWFALHEEYGDMFRLRLGPPGLGLDLNFDVATVSARFFQNVLGQFSLVGLSGDLWKKHRRLISPFFDRTYMTFAADIANQQTRKLIDRWRLQQPGSVIEAFSAVKNLTVDISGLVGFGYDLKVQENPDSTTCRAPIKAYHLAKQQKVLDDLVSTIIQQRLSDQEGTRARRDLLSLLFSATDPESRYKLSEQEVHNEIITFIFGGFETTASSLCWFLYHIGKGQVATWDMYHMG
ncbi:cytochrome P450 4F3-like [Nematostella vectensis]|uniref:cytochrome P450 4F3-like n=1 Tax=Nematostella vectensis TaxID=45351 RepID=UPI00207710D6|nr:cytochrome P450 4F3-like [Nematostella vectensis]